MEAGETIEITDRGRPVAILAPRPSGNRLDQLRATGDLVSASEDHDTLPPPLPLPAGKEPPARVLERLCDDER